ncbi:hypothetical protein B0H65DRAFT_469025 [Neurospora tetraspora]|uniref:Uncharacterized protein n=1 Tax=Neurospora tetraspora TaxID=94610 RepID=A0AAE0MQF1_9PEZI|nr:hypothetical protein B0H65DRAFT_469025 [Neurospora tetraspora]
MDKKSAKDVPASTAARPVEKAAPANNKPKVPLDSSRRALEIHLVSEQLLLMMREVQDAQEKTVS